MFSLGFGFFSLMGLAIPGCDEEQLGQADKIVTDVNDLKVIVGQLLESPPARAFLPPDIQVYGAAGIALVSIIVNGWQKVRSILMTKTTKAIVRGIEIADKPKSNLMSAVKRSIETQMKLAGVLDKGDKLVDQLKISR